MKIILVTFWWLACLCCFYCSNINKSLTLTYFYLDSCDLCYLLKISDVFRYSIKKHNKIKKQTQNISLASTHL